MQASVKSLCVHKTRGAYGDWSRTGRPARWQLNGAKPMKQGRRARAAAQHTAGDAESANPFPAGSSATSGDARPRGASRVPGGLHLFGDPDPQHSGWPTPVRTRARVPPHANGASRLRAPAHNSRHTKAKFANRAANKAASTPRSLTRNREKPIKSDTGVINASWHAGCNHVFNGEANTEWRSRKTRNGDRK